MGPRLLLSPPATTTTNDTAKEEEEDHPGASEEREASPWGMYRKVFDGAGDDEGAAVGIIVVGIVNGGLSW